MTFEQMQAEAELLYESIDSSAAPGFTASEWGRLFTVAQRKIVYRILREGITKDAFNQQAINNIIRTLTYPDFERPSINPYFYNSDGTLAWCLATGSIPTFNQNFFWILDEYVNTKASGSIAAVSNVRIKRITFDYYRSNLDNPFRKPTIENGFWLLHLSPQDSTTYYWTTPVIITDGKEPDLYRVVGVYHPDNYPIAPGTVYPKGYLDLGLGTIVGAGTDASILNPSAHSMIVEEAVTLARMSVVDPQGYQLAMAEFNK